MATITIETKKHKEVADITKEINKFLEKQEKDSGLVFLCVLHTTCALTTADLDPGTDLDMLNAFEAIIPKLKYRHPHNPSHVGDHIMSSIIGASLILPFENKNLVLGTWQRIVLIEFDGPRERKIFIKII
jgi:secondary thiamine-phosphate synthase enzyme